MRKKKNLARRVEENSSYLVCEEDLLSGQWRLKNSHRFSKIFLEIGCGKGRFITEHAKKHKDTFFIGIERELNALVMALERATAEELENIIFISDDALKLDQFFKAGEIDRIYINFCDPWPPKKQAKRRLTHSGFLSMYKKILKEHGDICFKTDNQDLFDFSLKEIAASEFNITFQTKDLHSLSKPNVMTEYEEKFAALGIKICLLEAVKQDGIPL